MKKSLLFILIIMCTSCSFEEDGLVTLRELCEKDAGLTIYKTVEADGYYDTTGRNIDLIKSAYQFFEYCDDSPHRLDIIPKSGCWRLSKVKRNTEQCYAPLDKKLSTFIVEPYPQFLKDHCISVKKIEKPTARYSYHSDSKAWTINGISEFRRSYALFRDRENDKVLSEYISYSYNKNPEHAITKSCHLIDDKFSVSLKKNFIEKTIITDKEDKND